MLTAQEIREKTFEKAVFGGYEMSGVDAFMEETAVAIATLQKENSVLKTKMKVLVDKIEEYRLDEDAMRNALLSAQKLSSKMEAEARAKADGILAKARAEAEAALSGITGRTAREKEKLAEAQRSSARFLSDMRAVCQKQMDFLNALATAMPKVEQAEPAAGTTDETVRTIENNVSRAVAQTTPRMDISADTPADPDLDDDGTRVFNFGD